MGKPRTITEQSPRVSLSPKTASLASLHTSQPIYLLGRVLDTQSHQSLREQVPGRRLPWKRPYSHPRSLSVACCTQTPISPQPLPALLQHRIHTTKPSPWAPSLPGLAGVGSCPKAEMYFPGRAWSLAPSFLQSSGTPWSSHRSPDALSRMLCKLLGDLPSSRTGFIVQPHWRTPSPIPQYASDLVQPFE